VIEWEDAEAAAAVVVDGQPLTPEGSARTLLMAPGTYRVQLAGDCVNSTSREVQVVSGKTTHVRLRQAVTLRLTLPPGKDPVEARINGHAVTLRETTTSVRFFHGEKGEDAPPRADAGRAQRIAQALAAQAVVAPVGLPPAVPQVIACVGVTGLNASTLPPSTRLFLDVRSGEFRHFQAPIRHSADVVVLPMLTLARRLHLRGKGWSIEPVNCAAVAKDCRRVIFGYQSAKARCYELESGRLVASLDPEVRGAKVLSMLTCVALSADGSLALTGDLQGQLRLWDVNSSQLLWSGVHPTAEGGEQKNIAISEVEFCPTAVPEVRMLSVASSLQNSYYDSLRIWNKIGGKLISRSPDKRTPQLRGASFSPDGRRVLAAHMNIDDARSRSASVTVWELNELLEIKDLKRNYAPTDYRRWGGILYPVWAHDGHGVLVQQGTASPFWWDLKTGRSQPRFERHSGRGSLPYNRAAFSSDGRYAAFSFDDFHLGLWDMTREDTYCGSVPLFTEPIPVEDNAAAQEALDHSLMVGLQVLFSPDGTRLVWVTGWKGEEEVGEAGLRRPRELTISLW
jgi:hypothetical protein